MAPSSRELPHSEVRVERPRSGVSVVCLVGEHDLATTADVSNAIATAIGSGDDVVLDLRSAQFIDSSTLHAIVTGSRDAAERDRRLVLVLGDNAPVVQIFELTSLLDQFERADSVEAALTALPR
jgi:anti-anti-sigma factor